METPLKSKKVAITSYFGPRTYIYKGKKVNSNHKGIDLRTSPHKANAEILAFADGVVVSVQKTGAQYGTGCYVRIKHSNGYQTLYYHLKSKSIVVNKGDKVKKGQKLGIIGTTGISTGIHLHFQIDKGSSSTAVNPYDYLFKGKTFIKDKKDKKEEVTKKPAKAKFKIGDKVIINGSLYKTASSDDAAGIVSNKTTKITRVAAGRKHPYNTTGDLGWMDESSIKLISSSSSPKKLKVGDKVKIIAKGNSQSNGKGAIAHGIGYIRYIKEIHGGDLYPYQVGNDAGTTGFYKASALKKQ